jgi:REP-associated tyrosine transposase
VTLYQDKYRIESTRHPGWDYRTPAWYFVTICTQHRDCVLGTVADGAVPLSAAGEVAEVEIRHLPRHYVNVSVDCHVVMPNHVHLLVEIDGQNLYSPSAGLGLASATTLAATSPKAGSLSALVRSYKSGVALRCHEIGLRNVSWQPRFYDQIVRKNSALAAVRDYVAKNPGNWPHERQLRETLARWRGRRSKLRLYGCCALQCPALSRFTYSRIAPGTPAGNCRKKAYPV